MNPSGTHSDRIPKKNGAPAAPHSHNAHHSILPSVQVGAKPIFVADGVPPPLKLRARTERFCRLSGLPPPLRKGDESDFASHRPLNSAKCARNSAFNAKVRDCLVRVGRVTGSDRWLGM